MEIGDVIAGPVGRDGAGGGAITGAGAGGRGAGARVTGRGFLFLRRLQLTFFFLRRRAS